MAGLAQTISGRDDIEIAGTDAVLALVDRTGRWQSVTSGALRLHCLGRLSNGLTPTRLAELWARRGETVLSEIRGDFALIVEDVERRDIVLARSPLSSASLYFRRSRETVIASSIASDVAPAARQPNLDSIAKWYGNLVGAGQDSMFQEVDAVPPATIVRWSNGQAHRRQYWDANAFAADPDVDVIAAAGRIRDALESAIGDLLLQSKRPASLLSAGRDSGAVTTVAARQLEAVGQPLAAFTASPGPDPLFLSSAMLVDEAPLASRVAAKFPNVEHHIVTPRGFAFCAESDQAYEFHSSPFGNPISLHWWTSILRQVQSNRCDLLLSAAMGNFTISDGGTEYLADVFRPGEWRGWWRSARDVAEFENASWKNILNISAGWMVPRSIYPAVQRVFGRNMQNRVAPYLTRDFAEMVNRVHRGEDQRFPKSSRQKGIDMINDMELGDIWTSAAFGVALCDPTADTRVVEACLRVPSSLLVSRYDRRPIFEEAFGDLLPREVIRAPQRAYQSMDWNFAYDVDDLRGGIERYRHHGLAGDLIDFDTVSDALGRWPVGRLASLDETMDFGGGVLRALSLASFLHVHFSS